jgi:hypothetical protein
VNSYSGQIKAVIGTGFRNTIGRRTQVFCNELFYILELLKIDTLLAIDMLDLPAISTFCVGPYSHYESIIVAFQFNAIKLMFYIDCCRLLTGRDY